MKHGLHILILCLFFSIVGEEVAAQYYRNQGYWKKDRWEFIAGVGASNFLGELGGRDQIGSDFIWDLETQVFQPSITMGARYATSKNTALRFQLSYAKLAGDDALTEEKFRANRNIHFKSHLIEVAGVFEYVAVKFKPGHRYNLAGIKGQKAKGSTVYLFAGLAGIHYNPQGKVGETWYDLKPLGTEGQNLRGGPDPYSLYSIAIPMGLGLRWRVKSNDLMVGIEIGHRMTFTDYIDDVSTVYFQNSQLGSQRELTPTENLLAAHFGDPSLGYFVGENGEQVPQPRATVQGQQRGDQTDNDAYLFAQVTMSYKIGKKPYKKRNYSSKKGKRVVF